MSTLNVTPLSNLVLSTLATAGAPPLPGQSTGGGALPGTGTGAGTGGGGGGFSPDFMLLMGGMILVLFLVMSLPARKEKKKREAMLSALKKHDRVQTIGGVIGSVVEVKPDVVVLKVDESSNTRMTFARSAIQSILKESPASSS